MGTQEVVVAAHEFKSRRELLGKPGIALRPSGEMRRRGADRQVQALDEVRAAAVDAAMAAAERVLRAKLTGSQADQLVDQSIQDLRGKLN